VAGQDRGAGSGSPAAQPRAGDWAAVRAQFDAPTRDVHLDGFVLAVPPLAVRNAVEEYRRRLDVEGIAALQRREATVEAGIRAGAARYMATQPELVALTDSTTMGLGIVYGAARLRPGDELVTSDHDFYATREAMRFAAARTGATVRTVRLYDDPRAARARDLVDAVMGAVGARTRMVGVTWVHSASGVRFPVRALAERLDAVNADRPPRERVLLVVDGVHGFGSEATPVADLGCDVFVSGCHKWLYGPRGTGVVWARRSAWTRFAPVIPTFDGASYEAWRTGHPVPLRAQQWAAAMTPGGFHSFENRWALAEAFDFHRELGRAAVAARIAELTERLRTGLARLPRVRVVSPQQPALRSALVCFTLARLAPEAAVEQLRLRGVRLSVTPYRDVYLRAGCPLLVDEQGIDRALEAIAAL
jgi:selenocysteine lyase/cysteine desulfurase